MKYDSKSVVGLDDPDIADGTDVEYTFETKVGSEVVDTAAAPNLMLQPK